MSQYFLIRLPQLAEHLALPLHDQLVKDLPQPDGQDLHLLVLQGLPLLPAGHPRPGSHPVESISWHSCFWLAYNPPGNVTILMTRYVVDWYMFYKGWGDATKTDEFSEKFQMAFDSPPPLLHPLFGKSCSNFFLQRGPVQSPV